MLLAYAVIQDGTGTGLFERYWNFKHKTWWTEINRDCLTTVSLQAEDAVIDNQTPNMNDIVVRVFKLEKYKEYRPTEKRNPEIKRFYDQ